MKPQSPGADSFPSSTDQRRATGALRAFLLRAVLALSVAISAPAGVAAQATQPAASTAQQPPLAADISAEPSDETTTFVFFNRPIVDLRARVLGRRPVDRAMAAHRVLDELVEQRITGPIELRPFAGGVLITVGSQAVLGLTAPDVDPVSGETVDGVAAQASARLRQAIAEAAEARAPRVIIRAIALSVFALLVGTFALWVTARAHRAVTGKLQAIAERTAAHAGTPHLEILRASRLLDFERGALTTLVVILDLTAVYATISFVLRQFPYTRPWGESMSAFLLSTVEQLALGAMRAVPGLFTVAIILFLARIATRLIALWFNAIELGRIQVRWIYPETAQPTRRILTGLMWAFAAVVSYPYLPGSETEAFKGVSVFVGLMVTIGSSGLLNQIMSSFMITYSRALRVGDFVKVGDTEGTVLHLGVLSIKIRSLRNEEITIPNAVVVAQTTTDYSRFGDAEGVYTPTSVTIGYDTPWRQVHSLLLLAAERTAGLRSDPKPIVLQAGLEDFYVKYTLMCCLARQQSRPYVLAALHSNIQDLFNEYGVQIMSPNYMLDPQAPKMVPKKDWFAAPARPE